MCSGQFDATYRRKADQPPPDLKQLQAELWKKYDAYAAKYGGRVLSPFDWTFAFANSGCSKYLVKDEINMQDCEQPPSPVPEDDNQNEST